jgi:V8-like Glu-specific endopeptidase
MNKARIKTLFFMFLIVCLNSCGVGVGPDAKESKTSTIFGSSDVRLISEKYFENYSFAKAVGNLEVILQNPADLTQKFAYPKCSAIQISPVLILTASHCADDWLIFNSKRIAKSPITENLKYTSFDGLLRLSYDGDVIKEAEQEEQQETMGPPVLINKELDYAVYKLKKSNGNTFIDIRQTQKEEDSTLQNLALYGFPNGVPLSVSDKCTGKISSNNSVMHTCDALNGSSGGLLVNLETKLPVGMHLSGPIDNDGFFYEQKGRFETEEELATLFGCEKEKFSTAEDYQTCVVQKGRNNAVVFGAILNDMEKNNFKYSLE